MDVGEKEYDKMLQFCQDHVGESFNHAGYFMYWAPIQPRPMFYPWLGMKPRWYCSEIVLAALQAGDLLSSDIPTTMHPHQLFEVCLSVDRDHTPINAIVHPTKNHVIAHTDCFSANTTNPMITVLINQVT